MDHMGAVDTSRLHRRADQHWRLGHMVRLDSLRAVGARRTVLSMLHPETMILRQRIRLATIYGPHGKKMESLREFLESRAVGVIAMPIDPAGWHAVQFPSMPQGDYMQVHVYMMYPVR